MTVEGIFSDGRLRCHWTEPTGLIRRAGFEPATVRRVDAVPPIPF